MVESGGKNEEVQEEETGSVQQPAPGMLGAGQSGRGGVVLSVGGEEQPNEVDLRRESLGRPVCCDSIKVTERLHNNEWL
jgi:hypothetical protein